jgi:hypothetical protein
MSNPTSDIAAAAEELKRCLARVAELIGQLVTATHIAAADADNSRSEQPETTSLPLLVDAEEAIRLLSFKNVRVLDALEARGELMPVRFGRAKRWLRSDIESLIAKQRRRAA